MQTNAEFAECFIQINADFLLLCIMRLAFREFCEKHFAVNKNVFIKLYFYYFKIELKGVNADAGRE